MASDRERFEAMLDEHGTPMLGLLRRLCGNPHDADDLFQEVATRVWRYREMWTKVRNVRPWLMTIAYRTFVDGGSKSARLKMQPFEESTHVPTNCIEPGGGLETLEARQAVEEAVSTLSQPLRSVVSLHYTGGLSLREVGQTLGVSIGTVKSRLSAALEQLRSRLQ